MHQGGSIMDQQSPADAARDLVRRVAAGRRQLLARAVGLHRSTNLHICDATAGLGRDAALMAALGARVDCFERHADVHAWLERFLTALPGDTRARIRLRHGDARELLGSGQWDVVYLDPMYTPSGKAALPRAHAQSLRAAVGSDHDADALLAPARAAARRRVVVKRAPRAPPLAGNSPMERMRGNSVRFDLYPPATAHDRIA